MIELFPPRIIQLNLRRSVPIISMLTSYYLIASLQSCSQWLISVPRIFFLPLEMAFIGIPSSMTMILVVVSIMKVISPLVTMLNMEMQLARRMFGMLQIPFYGRMLNLLMPANYPHFIKGLERKTFSLMKM